MLFRTGFWKKDWVSLARWAQQWCLFRMFSSSIPLGTLVLLILNVVIHTAVFLASASPGFYAISVNDVFKEKRYYTILAAAFVHGGNVYLVTRRIYHSNCTDHNDWIWRSHAHMHEHVVIDTVRNLTWRTTGNVAISLFFGVVNCILWLFVLMCGICMLFYNGSVYFFILVTFPTTSIISQNFAGSGTWLEMKAVGYSGENKIFSFFV